MVFDYGYGCFAVENKRGRMKAIHSGGESIIGTVRFSTRKPSLSSRCNICCPRRRVDVRFKLQSPPIVRHREDIRMPFMLVRVS